MTLKYAKHALAAILIVALPAMAQRPSGSPDPSMRFNFLAGYLGLTDAQKEQAKAIFDAGEAAREAGQGQMQAAREALNGAVKANKTDFEIDQLAAVIGNLQGQAAAAQAKAQKKLYAILTAEQKQKLDAMEAMEGRRTGGPGRPGRP